MSQPRHPPKFLPKDAWAEVVRHAPLVSIDLVVRAPDQTVLVGWRRNRPAREMWFVPGGVIRKNERIDDAFRRVCETELGVPRELSSSELLGVHEHFYDDNFSEDASFGTHYVVIVRQLQLKDPLVELPTQQHKRYAWMSTDEILRRDDVHEHVQAYFVDPPVRSSVHT